uniref:Uncharacterized protein n=1 Tax=viral metagenome TaxID=1070528 RepID=A0A6C0HRV2_9ZZZZ
MDVVSMEEFAETIYQMKKEMRKKDDEIEGLKREIFHLEELLKTWEEKPAQSHP